MPIKLYNTLSRKKENFKPHKGRTATYYTCGPTVYDFVHIGNLRTFIFEDLLRRVLEINGFKVKQIMNITDVDDKTINGARKLGKSLKEFTIAYENAFLNDIKSLNIEPASKYPRATEHIPEMIKIIKRLLKKEVAYKIEDGIYFSISKFKNYGKLSRVKKRELKTGTRILKDEYEKDGVQDFALWKFKKEGEPSWPAFFGEGRPGWHIECSAMSVKYLGMPIDIHSGGVDLIFPHHENEIAQSEAAFGKKFARFFVEGEHLMVDRKKMSKSLGNLYTLGDLVAKGFSPLDFRYLTLTAHYRSPLSFTWESLGASRNARLKLGEKALNSPNGDKKSFGKFKKDFISAINDDLNIPKALGLVWKSKGKRSILFADKIFGLELDKVKKTETPKEIAELLREREILREDKKWARADQVRKKILEMGYIVEDTASGPKLKKT